MLTIMCPPASPLQFRPVSGRVRNVSELQNIVCTFWLYVSSSFHCLFLRAAKCLSELQGGRGSWDTGTPGLSLCVALSSVPQTQEAGGNLLASIPGPQFNAISQHFCFPLWGPSSCIGKGWGAWFWGWLVPALGGRLARGVCPLHPLIILMLHLLFTFVLLYIGL